MGHLVGKDLYRKLGGKVDGLEVRLPWSEGSRTCACKLPLHLCAIMGVSAETVVRHGFGREASKPEMLEHFARAREMGLVFNADNVQRRVGNLQNTLCDGYKVDHAFLRGFVGGFLRLPTVKRSLVSEVFSSRFLTLMRSGAPHNIRPRTRMNGKSWFN